MLRLAGRAALATVLFLPCPVPAAAQPAGAVGTRAAGMSGAFVAVADDPSAVYWNPGALATGPFFGLVVDRSEGRTGLDDPAAGSRSGLLIALAAPALGLTYYRLRTTTIAPQPSAAGELGAPAVGPGQVRLDSLVTHHIGGTVVQSVTDRIAVGATLKLVRGAAAIADVRDRDRKGLLADGVDLPGRSTTRLDADLGIVAAAGRLRAGLTVRNVREPEFPTGSGEALTLERQVRGGLALLVAPGWTVAADLDLRKTSGPFGPMRDAAFGTEARLARRAVVRGGVRFNTTAGSLPGRAPSASAGGSYAIRAGVLVDAQVTAGGVRTMRGWGVAARFVY